MKKIGRDEDDEEIKWREPPPTRTKAIPVYHYYRRPVPAQHIYRRRLTPPPVFIFSLRTLFFDSEVIRFIEYENVYFHIEYQFLRSTRQWAIFGKYAFEKQLCQDKTKRGIRSHGRCEIQNKMKSYKLMSGMRYRMMKLALNLYASASCTSNVTDDYAKSQQQVHDLREQLSTLQKVVC
ncbi:hypothetical protein LXL04_022007 [Taraxacum kok-saghyz]